MRRLIVLARQWAERLAKPVRVWMSDKQDAFVKAIAKEFPGTPHRYCQNHFAQFIGVCSSVKTCEIGENLLSVSDPISGPQERLIHAGALVSPPPLQRRTVSSLHPYAAVERSSAPMSPVPEPRRRSLGHVPLPTRCKRYWCNGCKRTFNDLTNTLLHQSKRSLAYWILATFLLCLVVFVSTHCQGVGGPYPDQLSLVLVAAQCRAVL